MPYASSARRHANIGLGLIALLLLIYGTGVGLAYYKRLSICWFPPHIVSDEERVKNAIARLDELAQHHPELVGLDADNCCKVEPDRSSHDYGVTLGSVMGFRQVELIRIDYGSDTSKSFVMLSDQCGEILREFDN